MRHLFMTVWILLVSSIAWGQGIQGNLEPAYDLIVPPLGGTASTTITVPDDVQLQFGTGTDAAFEYDTAQTPDSLVLGVGADSNTFLLIQKGDIDFDFAHALAPDPTFCVHSANQSTTEYWCITHDQTNGVYTVGTGVHQLVGNVEITGQSYSTIPATLTPSGTTETVNWNNGNAQIIDLESATGDVTLTLSNPVAGASYLLKVIQDSTTPRDLVWPAAVLWPDDIAPVITTTGDAEDLISLWYDGTSYYASYGQDYQ